MIPGVAPPICIADAEGGKSVPVCVADVEGPPVCIADVEGGKSVPVCVVDAEGAPNCVADAEGGKRVPVCVTDTEGKENVELVMVATSTIYHSNRAPSLKGSILIHAVSRTDLAVNAACCMTPALSC
jgi:hypothetical protein